MTKAESLQAELENLVTLRAAITERIDEIAQQLALLLTGKRAKKNAPLNYRRTKI